MPHVCRFLFNNYSLRPQSDHNQSDHNCFSKFSNRLSRHYQVIKLFFIKYQDLGQYLAFKLYRRPWYHRALVNPAKAAVSNAYMDANGIGKVITISEAVFQALPRNTTNISCGGLENLPGGCPCTRYDDACGVEGVRYLYRTYVTQYHTMLHCVLLCHDVSRFRDVTLNPLILLCVTLCY